MANEPYGQSVRGFRGQVTAWDVRTTLAGERVRKRARSGALEGGMVRSGGGSKTSGAGRGARALAATAAMARRLQFYRW